MILTLSFESNAFSVAAMPLSRLVLLAFIAAIAAAIIRFVGYEVVNGAAEAIDGDSIRIGQREIRLKGIDAPEYRQTCQGERGEVACGRDARAALVALLARGSLRCDISGRDRYGRDLGHCFAGEVDVNAAMVKDGHAVAFGDFVFEEAAARSARRGLWATRFDPPSEWRRLHPRNGAGS
ncbi:thermonuclease family protein [Terrarubrum flagellatum]|uniref:thermonuclease family protein n=1 Tax=Terrirubrum flagellatum TaxID=2895980 RepID=UPI0031450980